MISPIASPLATKETKYISVSFLFMEKEKGDVNPPCFPIRQALFLPLGVFDVEFEDRFALYRREFGVEGRVLARAFYREVAKLLSELVLLGFRQSHLAPLRLVLEFRQVKVDDIVQCA